jgi:hypothetical protein
VDKETFLQKYVDIETKNSLKEVKNKKLEDLFNDFEIYKANLNLIDVIGIIDYLVINDIIIRQQLFRHLIYPILSKQVEQNDIIAIKGLLRLDQLLISYRGYTKDAKYSSWILLEKGLSISPDDRELLELSESNTRNYLISTLHELPSGILYGTNGANIEECEELIEEIGKYELLCDKLQLDESELIQKCKYYYSAYKNYLSSNESYNSFPEYLDKVYE